MKQTRKTLHSFGIADKCENPHCNNTACTIAFWGITWMDNGIAVCSECAKIHIRKGYNVVMTFRLYRGDVVIATHHTPKGLLKYFKKGDKIVRV